MIERKKDSHPQSPTYETSLPSSGKPTISELAQSVVEYIEQDKNLATRLSWIITRTMLSNPDIATHLIDDLHDRFPQSVLSDQMIKQGIKKGDVVISPLREDRIKTSSYDVSLGEYYWTTQRLHPGKRVFNPHNPNHVRNLWQGPVRAKSAREYLSHPEWKQVLEEDDFTGLRLDDPVIILAPGETILAHTDEFIGGRRKVTTMMKARSSWGRAFLSVCKDAGWGDVGYFNRWTMEIQNNLKDDWSIVPVGQPIAQIVFFRVNPVNDSEYSSSGNYQTSQDLEELKQNWKPEMMLPRLQRKPSAYGQ